MSTSDNTLIHPHYRTGTWVLDPAHSEISFTVRHLAISKVRGHFEKFDVKVITTDNPADSKVEASIDVSSVNTKQEQRDNHLRTSDFFKVDEFPTATFKSTSYELDGDEFKLVGDLTLRGVTKSIELAGEFGGILTDNNGGIHAGVSAQTKLNRHDFGVSWNAALEAGGMTLGDIVTLNIDLELILQD